MRQTCKNIGCSDRALAHTARRLGALREHPPHTTQSTKQELAYKLHAAHKQMQLSRNDQHQQLPSTSKACSHHA